MHEFINQYSKSHPDRVARYLEMASVDVAVEILESSTDPQAALLQHVSPTFLVKLLTSNHKDFTLNIISKLNLNSLVTVLKQLDIRFQEEVENALPALEATKLSELLQYDIDQVGYFLDEGQILLNENSAVSSALKAVDSMKSETPIFVISTAGEYLGRLNLISLIKNRDNQQQAIRHLVNKKDFYMKASTPIKNIISHRAWITGETIPVVGKTNCFLGVISRQKIKYHIQKVTESEHDFQAIPSDKLFYAYDAVWEGLQRFWGAVK